ncbi:MAG: SLBB domain-containing protein [Verrucomicrobiota bacterium]|nr:SLBB domain-containing protein [Verrucomicrobiota bacterium]
MDSLAKLPVEKREQLKKQYGYKDQSNIDSAENGSNDIIKLKSTESNPNTEKNFDPLEDLIELERLISEDILELEVELADDLIDSQRLQDATYELKECKDLLRRLKSLQRSEIDRKTESIQKDSQKKYLRPFGHDLFFEVNQNSLMIDAPVPSDYRIGPGDLIEVQLFGQRNASYSLKISSEGIIRFPEIGPINVFEGGTSFVDLKNLLQQKITDQLGAGVQSSISLGAFRSINVLLLGEVEKQGVLRVSSMASVVDVLLGSSGIKETGSLRKVQLNRSGNPIATIDLYELLLRGDSSSDQSLEPGDVVFVPVINDQVSVDGAVRRPAKYELLGNENLSDIIDLAGGLDARAVSNVINLERLDENFYPMIKSLNLAQESEFKIRDGDILRVDSSVSNIRNAISLMGATEKSGEYEWKIGLELQDLITNRLDLSTNVDLEYGLVSRKSKNGKIKCLTFVPSKIFDGEGILLFPEDKVYFFSKSSREESLESLISDLRLQTKSGEYAKLVRVSGSVHFPGEYPFTESMSVDDLIRAGGGTKDSTYMMDAEITRIHVDSEQVASVKHIRVDQKSLTESNTSKQFKLQPYDVLSLKPIPLWREGESIELSGEFRFPGIYSIKSGETLLDVIDRAGGLSERAFPKGAVFSRQSLRENEEKQKERLIAQLESDLATATLSATDPAQVAQAQSAANAMLSRLRSSKVQGRLVIDLEKLLKTRDNFQLLVKADDKLFVPQIPYSVSVSGEVQFPTSHLHQEGLDLDDYIKRSGGFTQNADKSRTFVVKANGEVMIKDGSAWFVKGSIGTSMNSGDVIVVPIDVKQTRFLENLTYGTQILYQLAVAAAAVNSF